MKDEMKVEGAILFITSINDRRYSVLSEREKGYITGVIDALRWVKPHKGKKEEEEE